MRLVCQRQSFLKSTPLYYGPMFRVVAIVVVALAAIDFFFLDGTYLHHVQAMLTDMRHHFLYR